MTIFHPRNRYTTQKIKIYSHNYVDISSSYFVDSDMIFTNDFRYGTTKTRK